MCGIFGVLSTVPNHSIAQLCKEKTNDLFHRGPDSYGIWANPNHTIALGHRRLSIRDLSESGHQPMMSPHQRFVITYNGEIYNDSILKEELYNLGFSFRGSSDTEIIICALEAWGVEKTLEKLSGMFALGIVDLYENIFYLVRDPLGIKPVYYTHQKEFFFASELKALLNIESIPHKIDDEALLSFLTYNNVPAPKTIYQNIFKLSPGTFLKLNLKNFESEIVTYWCPEKNITSTTKIPFKESVSQTHELLKNIVHEHLVSDVPVGCFLSGGTDSSLVASIASKYSTIETFTIGFHEADFNEANIAKQIAQHLGTSHNELYVRSKDVQDLIPNLATIYDEPFADSSSLPTLLVSKLASSKTKVVLSGDGGDEVFGGYNRHLFAHRYFDNMPSFIKPFLQKIIACKTESQWDDFANIIRKLKLSLPPQFGQKLYKFKNALSCETPFELYDSFIRQHPYAHHLLKDTNILNQVKNPSLQKMSLAENFMLWDIQNYLHNDVLTKVDRASMHHSLEVRVPFLDKRVVEFGFSLPISAKINQHQTKWVLKKILEDYLPKDLIHHPKKGFAVPLSHWLRTDLFEQTDQALHALKQSHLPIDGEMIDLLWDEHKNKKCDNSAILWSLFSLQLWFDNLQNNKEHIFKKFV